jgi:hypothetical protein
MDTQQHKCDHNIERVAGQHTWTTDRSIALGNGLEDPAGLFLHLRILVNALGLAFHSCIPQLHSTVAFHSCIPGHSMAFHGIQTN